MQLVKFLIVVAVLVPVSAIAGAKESVTQPSPEKSEAKILTPGYFEFTCTESAKPFVIEITDQKKIKQARDILAGTETHNKLITGTIVAGKKSYNPNWSFHIDPSSLSFTNISIEVCSAAPEMIESHLEEVGGSFLPNRHWCPWCGKLSKEVTIKPDTTSFLQEEKATLTTPSGKTFKIRTEIPKVNPEDIFMGTDRMAAKTTFPRGVKTESLKPLDVFISELLATTPDSFMLQKKIPKTKDSDRVAEEKRVVVVDAYIFASKKETDNDFHVILTTDPAKGNPQYFTAEVTGIPKYNQDFIDDLLKPRKQFKDFFKDKIPGSRYDIYDPPIHVKMTGALFFDVDHKAGVVGPSGHRPKTAWEIHPVMDLQFLE